MWNRVIQAFLHYFMGFSVTHMLKIMSFACNLGISSLSSIFPWNKHGLKLSVETHLEIRDPASNVTWTNPNIVELTLTMFRL